MSGLFFLKQEFFRQFQAVAAQRRIFQFGHYVASIIVFAVAAEAEQIGHDELRAVAGAGTSDRVANDIKTRGQIIANHGMRFDAVAHGFIRKVGADKLAVIRRGIGVLVVGDDEDEREFFHGRLIKRFVKRSGGSRAFAETCRADKAGDAFHPPCE